MQPPAAPVMPQAQFVVPDLLVEEAGPPADTESLERLALWLLQRVSPIVTVDPPDGIVINSAGANHLHGGETTMAERQTHRLIEEALPDISDLIDTLANRVGEHALYRFAAVGRINELAERRRLSRSAIVEAAVASFLLPDGLDQREAALTRRLDRLSRQIARVERYQRINADMPAFFIRFWPTVTSPLAEDAGRAAQTRGAHAL